jgi:transcription elongation factor Elf1
MQINRCPKCGREPSVYCGSALLNGEMRDVSIECEDCGLHTGSCKTRDEAVTKWNEMTKGMNK